MFTTWKYERLITFCWDTTGVLWSIRWWMKLSISRRKSKLVVLIMYYALHYNLMIFEFPSISWCSLCLDFPRKRRTQARNLPSDSKVPIQGRCKIASPAWDFYSSCYLSIYQTDLADSKSQHINNLSWKIESNPTHSTNLSLIWTPTKLLIFLVGILGRSAGFLKCVCSLHIPSERL